jgi:hypothetical protein
MSNLGNAYALALSLYARDKEQPLEDMTENLYHVVAVLAFGEDERKADLYTQLVEQLEDDMPFERVVEILEQAMANTDRRYPRG